MLGEADDGDQQPDQDHEGPEVSRHTHHLRVQPELGDREAEPGECEGGPDVGEQRAVARQQISQLGAVISVHGRFPGNSWPRVAEMIIHRRLRPRGLWLFDHINRLRSGDRSELHTPSEDLGADDLAAGPSSMLNT